MSWLDPRMWLAVLMAVGLSYGVGHWRGDSAGRALVRADWDKDVAARTVLALAAEQAARAKEQTLQANNAKVSADYEKQKASNRRLAVNLDDSVRQFQAALGNAASPNAAAAPGTHGTGGLERELLGSCSKSLAELAQTADRLEGKVVGLQSYVAEVCKN